MAKKKNSALDLQSSWQFPSNHQNLLFMLGSGLISKPDEPDESKNGSQSKYYKDILSLCPGWIPLFKGSVPEKASSMSTERRRGGGTWFL
jgi:hypothetical protein